MAASSPVGRIFNLCKKFQNILKVSSSTKSHNAVFSFDKCCVSLYGGTSSLANPLSHPVTTAQPCRPLHTTICRRGLDEFFDFPENRGEATVKSGAPWTAKQLRTKSNEDLHKLWYVLLKEKNMLLTLEQEARRQRLPMPSPERIRKVERSMIRLETIVSERETALRLLQTGQEKGRPGAWRKNKFGYTYWYRFKEYAIPWYMNRRYKRKQFFTPSFVEPHIRLRIERHLRERSREANMQKEKLQKFKERFPQMKMPAS
ncbi:unnamed protein product [Knipowitschia caucasica]|uniref:Large ribosomal subunit protein uL29m n=1 Tax=Knipowitschia caucasica TaxID=637954 RepID=A0AAV2KY25_KNICA